MNALITSREDLALSFEINGLTQGMHEVLYTGWDDFKDQLCGFDLQPKFEALKLKIGAISILDQGCGSTRTIFEATEHLETGRDKTLGPVNAFGITASAKYFAEEVPEPL